jgi:hypothetical protein
MRPVATLAVTTNSQSPPVFRLWAVAILTLITMASGCSQLRLPANDPTRSSLFTPKPTTTTLALPGSGGESCICSRCLGGLRGCLNRVHSKIDGQVPPRFAFPTPAFVEPVTPPPCAVPAPAAAPGKCNGPFVPSEPCNGSCKDGPPAVLFGDECRLRNRSGLPNRGKRGCILLSPQKIVAPVGGEVVLLSGICGTEGYLQMNEKLEWMLTPESVGTFIQVGDDDPGLLHRLVGSGRQPVKHDPSYAHGLTSTKRTLITRGNLDSRDDVQLEKGQTWITISSPSEGTSRVTVLAPDSECWDQRKATATIYWIDATWQFPGPQLVQAGQPVELTTRVTRAEGTLPAEGWKVRYEILQPELATFAGTNGSSVIETTVDLSGNATVQLLPNPGTSGTATIDMQVIRPGGQSDNMPSMTLGRGQTYVTWSSPQLAIRAGAPAVATFNVPVEVVINVSNPGDQAATNVRVDVPIPQGVVVTGTDTFATTTPGAVIWEIGTIPPQQQLDLFMSIATQSPVQLPFQATADGLRAEDTVRIDVFRPSIQLSVQPETDRYQAGQPATFNIDVTNIGNRPLQNVVLTVTGDEAMQHADGGRVKEKQRDGNAPLQPGETWPVSIDFVPTNAGRRCITVQTTADGGQLATQDGCVTVINAIPPAQLLSATLQQAAGRSQVAVGQSVLVTAQIANTGEVTLRNIQITMVNDPQLQLQEATEEGRTQASGNLVIWSIPAISPGQAIPLEGRFIGSAPISAARVQLSAVSGEGVRANAEFAIAVVPTVQPTVPEVAPPLPPVTPSPGIPGGAAPQPLPLQGVPSQPTAPPLPARTDSIQLDLFGRDNPVAVGNPIRYALSITNDSDEGDSQVSIQFQLPDGVEVVRVNPRTNPELGQFQNNAGVITLAPIRTMNPGERVDYELVLRSNQPQSFNLDVQARSLRRPAGVSAQVQTDVR